MGAYVLFMVLNGVCCGFGICVSVVWCGCCVWWYLCVRRVMLDLEIVW